MGGLDNMADLVTLDVDAEVEGGSVMSGWALGVGLVGFGAGARVAVVVLDCKSSDIRFSMVLACVE